MSDQQKLSERMRLGCVKVEIGGYATEQGPLAKNFADRVEAIETQLAEAIQERDEARATIQELRTINVEPGISLGLARDWKAQRDALEKALRLLESVGMLATFADPTCPCKSCIAKRAAREALAELERPAPEDGGKQHAEN